LSSTTDILPLVEFEVDNQVTHEQVQSLREKSAATVNSSRSDPQNWTQKIDLNSQTMEMYSNDSLLTETESDRLKVFNVSDKINPLTNLIVLNESNLAKLDLSNLIITGNSGNSESHRRYFFNMMPQIDITSCAHCHKVICELYDNPTQ